MGFARKPTKLTARQERYLSKIGLFPLISTREISRRTGIPIGVLELVERPNPLMNETKLRLVERFEKKPSTSELLNHPKLWVIARLRKMAKDFTVAEIRQMLLEEASLRNAIHNSNAYKAPALSTIHGMISKLGFRTAEDLEKIMARVVVARRKRTPNNLSLKERKALLEYAHEFLKRHIRRNESGVTAEDVRTAIEDSLIGDVIYFNPNRWGSYNTMDELVQLWDKRLKVGLKFLIINALRKIRPISRSRKTGKVILSGRLEQQPAKPSEEPQRTSIRFREPLTDKQREVFKLKLEGLPNKQIAILLNLRIATVSKRLAAIRKKIIKE